MPTFPEMVGNPDFFFRSLSLGYSHQSQDKQLEAHLRSIYSLEYIRHKVIAQADLRMGRNLDLDLSWRYVDRNTGSALLAPYALLDAKLNYAFPWMSLYVRVNNLLNRTWYDFGDIPQPGLWLMAGISCRLLSRQARGMRNGLNMMKKLAQPLGKPLKMGNFAELSHDQ